MDIRHDLDTLAIKSLDRTSLAELEDQFDQSIGSTISKQQVLNTYLGWLREQLVMDMFLGQDSLVDAWIRSLRKYGFEKGQIYQSFKDWQRQEALANPSTLRRFLMIEQELYKLLGKEVLGNDAGRHNEPYHVPLPQNVKQHTRSDECNIKNTSNPIKDAQQEFKGHWVGTRRTGANNIPVTKRRNQKVSVASPNSMNAASSMPCEPQILSYTDKCATSTIVAISHEESRLDHPYETNLAHETISLDTALEKMLRRPRAQHNPSALASSSGAYISALKAGRLEWTLPPDDYTCKRCHQKGKEIQSETNLAIHVLANSIIGHWLHLCPTNLDPSYDAPPDPGYLCHFCRQMGDHFATLCPQNDKEWSLTQQRKNPQSPNTIKQTRAQQSSPKVGSSSYRPRYAHRSGYQEADKFRPRYRNERSSSPSGSSRRDRRRRANLRRADVIPATSHGTKMRKGTRAEDDAESEGRLFYEDDDISSIITDAPFPDGAKELFRRPQTAIDEDKAKLRHDSIPMRPKMSAYDQSSPCSSQEAAIDANDFLQQLHDQIQEEKIKQSCLDEVKTRTDQVYEHTDPFLFRDGSGSICKKVTNPPFSNEVVRLFASRPIPVIVPHSKRRRTLDFWT
jgi:hypothetical protein